MKKILNSSDVNCINENMINELYTLESLVKTTVENCLNKECSSEYYREDERKKKISEERNNYINILTVALSKIKHIQMLNTEIENLIIKSSH